MSSNIKHFLCKTCPNTYSKASDMYKHLKWHEKLLKHMQTSHVKLEQTKIYSCGLCTRGFLDRAEYRVHHRQYFSFSLPRNTKGKNEDNNNEIDKPYGCDECGKRFVLETTLETHLIIHRPFPFICKCGIGYYKKCDLDSHRKLVHPTVLLEEDYKVTYKSDSEKNDSDYEEKPSKASKAKPRLKAALLYKKKKPNSASKKPQEKHETKNGQKCYKCKECPEEFTNRNHYYKHKMYHMYGDSKRFKCEFCDKAFKCKAHLVVHTRTHTKERPFKCDKCPKSFTQRGARNIHKKRHEGLKEFSCDECGKSFIMLQGLVLHKRIHTGEKPYECETCGKCFSDPSAFKRHKFMHTGLKPHKCGFCEKSYNDPAALYRHKQLHLNATVPCKLCDKSFTTRPYMLLHVKKVHRTMYKFECDVCRKLFDQKQYLVRHMVYTHLKIGCEGCKLHFCSIAELKQHKLQGCIRCSVCNMTFTFKKKLEHHMTMSHRPKDSQERVLLDCESCPKQFSSKHKLSLHIKHTHDVKVAFTCDHCNSVLPTKSVLERHIWKKHMISLYCNICLGRFCNEYELHKHKKRCKSSVKCEICDRTYMNLKSLRTHLLCHAPKKLECDACGDKFACKSNLKRHFMICSEIVQGKSNKRMK